MAVLTATVALPASPAGAATQVGQTIEPTGNCSPRTRIQSASPADQYVMPFAGVITSWSFQSNDAGGASPLKVKIARRAGGNNFTIVAQSDFEFIPDADALLTFPTRLSVQAGDLLGLHSEPPSVFLCTATNAAYGIHEGGFGIDTAPGLTAAFTPVAGQQLDVSVQLEPDCDNDGFGDETQDSDLTPCDTSPPDTQITSGPKAKTKKKQATFEFTGTDARAVTGFECSLDGGAFAACTSPHTVKVKKGKHTFSVRAADTNGNRDGTPATYDWKVKKKKKKK